MRWGQYMRLGRLIAIPRTSRLDLCHLSGNLISATWNATWFVCAWAYSLVLLLYFLRVAFFVWAGAEGGEKKQLLGWVVQQLVDQVGLISYCGSSREICAWLCTVVSIEYHLCFARSISVNHVKLWFKSSIRLQYGVLVSGLRNLRLW